MRTIVKGMLVVAGIGIVAAQFIARPGRTNPPEEPSMVVTHRLAVPPDVRAILERSCFDCHSNRTAWRWYSAIAPVSWIVARDVDEGREQLNFSEWGTYSPRRQAAKLEMIIAEVDKGRMPLASYALIHGEAVLSDADKDLLCEWAGAAADSIMARAD